MWFPFQLSPKEPHEGPHYAGYNERAIATTIDLMVFLFLMLRPIYWMEYQVRQYFQPYVDYAVFDRLQPHAVGLSHMEQFRLALQGFIDSGIWKPFLSTNLLAIYMVMAVYVLCMLVFHTTPGKWLMGVKVTKRDHHSTPAPWQIILRSFFAVISCIPLMLGLFWMVFDKQSRTWHDIIAGTRVITTRPDGWYWNKLKQGAAWLRNQLLGPPPPQEPPSTP
jgi:uncharacterized RDD family membrane protein YckC